VRHADAKQPLPAPAQTEMLAICNSNLLSLSNAKRCSAADGQWGRAQSRHFTQGCPVNKQSAKQRNLGQDS
jgi:hypothetical protein